MDFERSDILKPILDDLEANDRALYWGIQQKVLGQLTASGQGIGPSAAALVIQSFQKVLSDRAEKIFSEMKRALDDSYIKDFDNLTEALKTEWSARMARTASVAYDFFISLQQRDLSTPSPIEYVAKIKPKWLAEIELFCTKLHDSQAPRLFLKAGEVFAEQTSVGNEPRQPSPHTNDSSSGPPIFVSHASEDRGIVTELIDTFNNGLHLPGGTFFCSSVPGMGIPNGMRFIDYIRETINETKLVIFLISPAFLKSRFCLAEAGAAWVKSADQFILLTPPLEPQDLDGVFDGIQAAKISDHYALNELRDRICNAVSPRPLVNANHWEK